MKKIYLLALVLIFAGSLVGYSGKNLLGGNTGP